VETRSQRNRCELEKEEIWQDEKLRSTPEAALGLSVHNEITTATAETGFRRSRRERKRVQQTSMVPSAWIDTYQDSPNRYNSKPPRKPHGPAETLAPFPPHPPPQMTTRIRIKKRGVELIDQGSHEARVVITRRVRRRLSSPEEMKAPQLYVGSSSPALNSQKKPEHILKAPSPIPPVYEDSVSVPKATPHSINVEPSIINLEQTNETKLTQPSRKRSLRLAGRPKPSYLDQTRIDYSQFQPGRYNQQLTASHLLDENLDKQEEAPEDAFDPTVISEELSRENTDDQFIPVNQKVNGRKRRRYSLRTRTTTRRRTRMRLRNHNSEDDEPLRRSTREKKPVQRLQMPNLVTKPKVVANPETVERSRYRPIANRRNRGRKGGRRHGKQRRPMLYNASDSNSCSTEEMMERKRRERLDRDRGRIHPINMGLFDEAMAPEQQGKKKNADISPMKIDLNVDWNSIGGLHGHIQKLKEMVVLPMLYPTEFAKFKMNPPKGVLFHGPPGTGKTLVARVLAAQCSQAGKKVSFYMRKGADCLSKWVGEAERQLRLLFDEAHKNQPSIIFFDEIDGLAPVRSSRQDQIHSSIVSTLLALMDGLDGRGQIIVIGATNRVDAIDPALRRPGRFDRELCFTLPSRAARKQILRIKTKAWEPSLSDSLLESLSEKSVGYCGADLEALCREAFMNSIRRTFPQIYESDVKLKIDPSQLSVTDADFETALSEIVPAAQRSQVVYARPLPKLIRPLLKKQFEDILAIQRAMFPLSCATKAQKMNMEGDHQKQVFEEFEKLHVEPCRPKLLISAKEVGHGQAHLGVAVLHNLEEYPSYSLALASLYGDPMCRCVEEVVLRIFKEARKNAPSVIYWPRINQWWEAATTQLRLVICSLIQDLSGDVPVFLVGTSDVLVYELPDTLRGIFHATVGHYAVAHPSVEAIEEFWLSLVPLCMAEPQLKVEPKHYPKLEVASEQKESESKGCEEEIDELELQVKLDFNRIRSFIRTCCSRLVKHFSGFCEVVNENNVASNDLSLLDVRDRNNNREYPSVDLFLSDIDQIVDNVRKSYNPKFLEAREYMNEACHLQDQALALACQADRDLVKRVNGHIERVKARGVNVQALRNVGKESSQSETTLQNVVKPQVKAEASQGLSLSAQGCARSSTKLPTTLLSKAQPSSNSVSTEISTNQPAIRSENDDKQMKEELCVAEKSSGEDSESRAEESADCPQALESKPSGDMPEPKVFEATPKRVTQIDKEWLIRILKRAARTCSKYEIPVFEMEDTYFRILNHIHHLSCSWNRSGLLELISQEFMTLEKVEPIKRKDED